MASTKPGRGYETRDVSTKVAVFLIVAIVVVVPVAMVGMNLLFDHFVEREARNQPRSRSLVPREVNPLPPAPRLQGNPFVDLKEHRTEEAAKANTYQWLDQEAGRVRIPVARAIDLIVERGLPARAPDRAAGGGATP